MRVLFMFIIVINSVRSIDEDVRWLQFVQRFQSQLNINSSINSLPMCTTWISNNYQSTSALDRTLENIEKWGKHCVSRYDCISGHISFQNHGLSVTEQLSAGVRRLVLELHFVPGLKRNLRLCASLQVECTAMKKTLKVKSLSKRRRQYNWCKGFMMMSRGVHTGCHSESPQFKDIIREIIRWLNKNQDQFIVVDIVDFVSIETGCDVVPEIDSSLKLFGSRLLKPSQLVTMKGDMETMPSLSELMEARKSVMFRSTCTFGGLLIFPANKTDYISLDKFSGNSCNQTEHPSPFTLFYHDKIHVDVILSQRQKLRQYRTIATPDRSAIQSAAQCNAPVALQTSNYSDLFACSWTWFPHHSNMDCSGCTAFSADISTQTWGWLNTNCSLELHLPCRGDNGSYSVTSSFHHLPNTLSLSERSSEDLCGAGAHFSLPLNPRDAYNLATVMWKHGLSHVWLPRIPLYTCTTTVQYITCGKPASPKNGMIIGEDFGFDGVIRFECDTGYDLSGGDVSVCQSNGSWSGSLPSCTRVNCGEPRQPLNGRSYGTSTDYSSMFGYTCNWGYVFEGQANTGTIVTTCQDNGEWDVLVPDCIQRQCEVSEWTEWGECSHSCASGSQSRTRDIVRFQGNEINGNCPPLEETQVCNERPCDTCTTTEYSTNIEADQCRSSESVINRYCSGACREKGKCCRPTMRSTRTIILFCDDSRPRNFQLPVIERCGCIPCG